MSMSPDDVPTCVEFRSDRFPPYDGEEDRINPGRWGQRLAEFLCAKLLAEGVQTDEPRSEDWGWRIDVVNEDFTLWIGCGRCEEHPDGDGRQLELPTNDN